MLFKLSVTAAVAEQKRSVQVSVRINPGQLLLSHRRAPTWPWFLSWGILAFCLVISSIERFVLSIVHVVMPANLARLAHLPYKPSAISADGEDQTYDREFYKPALADVLIA